MRCTRPRAGIPLHYAFAVCPVISPRAGLASIEDAPWFYERYFMLKWRGSLRRKQALCPDAELFSRERTARHLRGLTRDMVVAPHRLRHAGKLPRRLFDRRRTLAALRIPATILTAADDPVIPVADFHALKLAAETELIIVPHGGHCGFIRDWRLHSWSEDFIAEHLDRALRRRAEPETDAAAASAA